MKKFPFKAIAAVSMNGVIGNDLHIPWHIPEDFKHFKSTTMGGVIVMGRRTWESIGKPLSGRENVVLTSSLEHIEGVKIYKSLEELVKAYENDSRTVWICGGAQIYKSALPLCSELVLTVVKRTVEGDVQFPEFRNNFAFAKKLKENSIFDVDLYVNKANLGISNIL